ncbi:IQ motif and SEC7 domain-containing protein 3 isoform X3 [Ascaphus truei]|uniref:IQ motif and SEC7 domain-containing protein 3 isoform X3 n=1 Tax=Ascaphus truei TaxID=8439 RepID=UPI003F59E35A
MSWRGGWTSWAARTKTCGGSTGLRLSPKPSRSRLRYWGKWRSRGNHWSFSRGNNNHRAFSRGYNNHRVFSRGNCNHRVFFRGNCNHRVFSRGNCNHRVFSRAKHNHRVFSRGNSNHRGFSRGSHSHRGNNNHRGFSKGNHNHRGLSRSYHKGNNNHMGISKCTQRGKHKGFFRGKQRGSNNHRGISNGNNRGFSRGNPCPSLPRTVRRRSTDSSPPPRRRFSTSDRAPRRSISTKPRPCARLSGAGRQRTKLYFTSSVVLLLTLSRSPPRPGPASDVSPCKSSSPTGKRHFSSVPSDDSCNDQLLCTVWDALDPDRHLGEEELLPTVSLHHTGSPARVPRGKSTATCSHGASSSDYELSLDLKNKQIEMLEHKYGGHLVSRRAACTIQTAFRQYQLSKNFEKIRDSLLQSRLPRRISLRKVRMHNPDSFSSSDKALLEGYNLVGIPLVRSPSLPATISGALTELEDSFTEQVQSLAKSIDDALSTWSLKTMCAFPEGGSYQIRETFSSMQQNPELEPPKLEEREDEEGQLGNLPKSSSTLMMAFRDVTVQIDNNNISVSSSTSLSMANCLAGTQTSKPEEGRGCGDKISESSGAQEGLVHDAHLVQNSFPEVNGDGLGRELVGLVPPEAEPTDLSEQLSSSSTSTSAKSVSEVSSKEALQAMILSLPRYYCENPASCRSPTLSTDTMRKRLYRIGLNLFNISTPDKGIQFLISRGFIPDTPIGVAHFLLQRKGLSRQMIGEFLGNSKKQFNRDVLDCVVDEMDFSGMELDEALRKFQAHIRVQGEAQKVERLIEAFSQRYCMCNPDIVQQFHNPDTIFILAFAIILLNTDMYSPSIRPDRKMMLEDFIRNLRGVDDGADIPRDMVVGIYERIQQKELKSNEDHVTYVTKVENSIVGMKSVLSVPHRRLVCCSRLFEVMDVNKVQKQAAHQREVFLFNDLLLILKLCPKKKTSSTYTFCRAVPLLGLQYHLYENEYYPHGITLVSPLSGSDKRLVLHFCALGSEELQKFLEDLKESICEVTEMEQIRIEWELEKQQGPKTLPMKTNGSQLDTPYKQESPTSKPDPAEKDTDSAVEVSIHNRLQTSQPSGPQGPETGAPGSTAANQQREALQAAPSSRLLQCQQIVKVIVLDAPGRALPALDQTVTRYLSGSCTSTPLRSLGGGIHQPPLPPPPPPYNHPHQYCPPGSLLSQRRYSSGSRSLV